MYTLAIINTVDRKTKSDLVAQILHNYERRAEVNKTAVVVFTPKQMFQQFDQLGLAIVLQYQVLIFADDRKAFRVFVFAELFAHVGAELVLRARSDVYHVFLGQSRKLLAVVGQLVRSARALHAFFHVVGSGFGLSFLLAVFLLLRSGRVYLCVFPFFLSRCPFCPWQARMALL